LHEECGAPAMGAPDRIVDLAVGTMRVTTIAERSR
jgi:hypothetical protein